MGIGLFSARGALHPAPPTPRTNNARLKAPLRLIENVLEAEFCADPSSFSTFKLHVLENRLMLPADAAYTTMQRACEDATVQSYSARGMRWQAAKAASWIDWRAPRLQEELQVAGPTGPSCCALSGMNGGGGFAILACGKMTGRAGCRVRLLCRSATAPGRPASFVAPSTRGVARSKRCFAIREWKHWLS